MKRESSIDILKFFAALLITNSHIAVLYPNALKNFATGGAIGDVLFFFCSGYTLFLGRDGGFFNWYKRRISRIYPTVFAWAIMSAFVFGWSYDMKTIVLSGGGWFVSCIMIYYVLLWFVRRYFIGHLKWMFFVTSIVTLVYYIYWGTNSHSGNIYGENYLKWIFYFLFVLMGASIGMKHKKMVSETILLFSWKHFLLLMASILFFYFLFAFKNSEEYAWVQLFSLLPLSVVAYYSFKLCECRFLKGMYDDVNIVSPCMKFVSGLCLEIYIVQCALLKMDWYIEWMKPLFPLNILVFFISTLLIAYTLRCLARFFSQTFKDMDYDWKEIIKAF